MLDKLNKNNAAKAKEDNKEKLPSFSVSSDLSEKNQPRKRFFKKDISTMQDDLVKIITNKGKLKQKSGEIAAKSAKDSEIQRELTEVYTDGNGEIPDLTKLEDSRRPMWKTVVYALIAVFSVLLMVALAGFIFFSNYWNNDNFTNEKITLKIDLPLTLVSGEEMTYTILITNKEKVNLYNAQLELFYPDNFEYLEAIPQAAGEKKNIWNFNALKTGETQKIELKGKIIAPLNSIQTFRAVLEFKPSNLNATFKQEAIVDAAVSSSIVSLNVTGPERTLINKKNEYLIKYKNLSQAELLDLELVVDYPQGFVIDSTEPEAEESGNHWKITKLAAEEEGEIKIIGDYSAVGEAGNQEFKARIQLRVGSDYYPQSEVSQITEVIKDKLTIQLIINGSAEDQPISFGDLLTYSLNYKNTGQEELKNIKITAHLSSPILDWDSLEETNSGAAVNGNIVWTGKDISKLLRLGPNEEGEITWQIRVKSAAAAIDKNINKFNVESYATAAFEQTGETEQSTVKTKTIVNSINSDLGLSAQARYYDEDNLPLGLGPITPKVGETSTYNIKLKLINSLHDIKDVRLVAALPKGMVSWTDKETHNSGDLIYDSNSNKVTWLISRLPKSVENTEITFNVSIKPTKENLGRVLILVSEITLSATDAETGANISKSLKAITTAFNDPILGQMTGVVE